MTIKVLISDDSDVMRTAILSMLHEDSNVEVVGQASSFAETVQMIGDLKPDLLLLDLHMAEKRQFAPASVKAQLACVEHVLAVSFANDAEAKMLAESYGAATLLDKMKLYGELLPAIRRCLYSPRSPLQSARRKAQAA